MLALTIFTRLAHTGTSPDRLFEEFVIFDADQASAQWCD